MSNRSQAKLHEWNEIKTYLMGLTTPVDKDVLKSIHILYPLKYNSLFAN